MAKNTTANHDDQLDEKTVEAVSKELMDVESADDAVEEVEKDDAREEDAKQDEADVKEPDNPHLKKMEQPNALKRFAAWFWRKKFITIPVIQVRIVRLFDISL